MERISPRFGLKISKIFETLKPCEKHIPFYIGFWIWCSNRLYVIESQPSSFTYMDVSGGFPPKSSILIGFSIINYPFGGPNPPHGLWRPNSPLPNLDIWRDHHQHMINSQARIVLVDGVRCTQPFLRGEKKSSPNTWRVTPVINPGFIGLMSLYPYYTEIWEFRPYLESHPRTWIRGFHNHGDRSRAPYSRVVGPPSKWPTFMAYKWQLLSTY